MISSRALHLLTALPRPSASSSICPTPLLSRLVLQKDILALCSELKAVHLHCAEFATHHHDNNSGRTLLYLHSNDPRVAVRQAPTPAAAYPPTAASSSFPYTVVFLLPVGLSNHINNTAGSSLLAFLDDLRHALQWAAVLPSMANHLASFSYVTLSSGAATFDFRRSVLGSEVFAAGSAQGGDAKRNKEEDYDGTRAPPRCIVVVNPTAIPQRATTCRTFEPPHLEAQGESQIDDEGPSTSSTQQALTVVIIADEDCTEKVASLPKAHLVATLQDLASVKGLPFSVSEKDSKLSEKLIEIACPISHARAVSVKVDSNSSSPIQELCFCLVLGSEEEEQVAALCSGSKKRRKIIQEAATNALGLCVAKFPDIFLSSRPLGHHQQLDQQQRYAPLVASSLHSIITESRNDAFKQECSALLLNQDSQQWQHQPQRGAAADQPSNSNDTTITVAQLLKFLAA